MRLTDELKKKIDNYYKNISADELYKLSVTKYRFTEKNDFSIKNQEFETSNVDNYVSCKDNTYNNKDNSSYALAA